MQPDFPFVFLIPSCLFLCFFLSFYLILVRYDGKDATDVFAAFHGQEAYEKLANMKGVPIKVPPPDAKIANFRSLFLYLFLDFFLNY